MNKTSNGENTPLLHSLSLDTENGAHRIPQQDWLEKCHKNLRNMQTSWFIPGVTVLTLFMLSILMIYTLNVNASNISISSLETLEIENPNLGATFGEKNQYGGVLEIPLGKLIPVIKSSRDGRNFSAFFKVPYATPPVGNLRFEPPRSTEGWNETRAESEVAPQCLQKSKYSPINESVGEESCLFMNIYSPKVPGKSGNISELMPTLVYIHGGGYVSGNGSRYGPEYFMDEDVVLITFNFRLGIFGFLNTGDGRIRGNMGMKDQVMALRWIQQFIEYFGGDPKRVTIFGNSSGGSAVAAHLLSPMSTRLFHRAIIQSGSSINGDLIDPNFSTTKDAVAKAANCTSENTESMITCLKYGNGSDLAIIRGGDIKYMITLEETGNESFLTEYPLSALQNGKINHNIPIIIGINSAEMLGQSLGILKFPALTNMLNENWTEVAPKLLNYQGSADTIGTEEISSKIKDFYFQQEAISNLTMRNLTNLFTDRTNSHCAKVEAVYHATANNVYLYYLTKEPPKSYVEKLKKGFPPGYYGATHADEIQFLFPYYGYPEIPKGSPHYAFSKMLVKAWSTFSSDGKPVEAWKQIRPAEDFVEWYQLDDQQKMVYVLESRLTFWDQFSFKNLNYK